MLRLNITAKIWLSIGVFIGGTLIAVGIGQVQAIAGESRLAHTNAVLFPAAQHGQEAEALVQRMAKGFGDAVVLEDESALDQAGQDGNAAAVLLKKTAELFGSGAAQAAAIRDLAEEVDALVKDGRAAYAPVIAAAGNLTPERRRCSRWRPASTPSRSVWPHSGKPSPATSGTSWPLRCSGRRVNGGCSWGFSSRR